MIFLNTLVVASASVIVAFILPKEYASTASIFPPEDDSWNAMTASSLISAATTGLSRRSMPIFGSPSDVYASVLKSRTVKEEIVRRFDLMKVYRAKDADDVLRRLRSQTSVKVSGEGIVSVRVLDRSPQRAADMANAYVELLDQVNREKRKNVGRQARIFLDDRLAQSRREMAAAEESLRAIQEQTAVLVPDDQLKAAFGAAATLKAQLVLQEVDLAVMRGLVGPEHPDRMALEREVATLRQEVERLDQGAGGSVGEAGDGAGSLGIPLHEYPARSMRQIRALREVKVQEAIYQFLSQQYENYRIQESRDTPMVQVLDRAVVAVRKARPIRWLLCGSATLIAFTLSLLLAGAMEVLARLRREDPERFAEVRALALEFRLGPLIDRI
jgi:tyrosine-protein kinase Etk/Wzc